jgi:hypothetical protein
MTEWLTPIYQQPSVLSPPLALPCPQAQHALPAF